MSHAGINNKCHGTKIPRAPSHCVGSLTVTCGLWDSVATVMSFGDPEGHSHKWAGMAQSV